MCILEGFSLGISSFLHAHVEFNYFLVYMKFVVLLNFKYLRKIQHNSRKLSVDIEFAPFSD